MKKLFILFICLLSINPIFSGERKEKQEAEERHAYPRGAAREPAYERGAPGRGAAQQAPAGDGGAAAEPAQRVVLNFDEDEVGRLEYYVFKNKIKKIKGLLEINIDPNGSVFIGDISDIYERSRWPKEQIPLMIAAIQGYFDVVKLLLDYGADPNVKDDQGHDAEYYAQLNGHQNIVDLLRKNKEEPKSVKIAKWKLHYAHSGVPGREPGSREETLSVLGYIEVGGEEHEDSIPANAQMIFKAAQVNNLELARRAVAEGQNINTQSSVSRTTPLILAAQKNSPDVVRFLLDHHAQAELKDYKEKTFMDYAREKPLVLAVVQQ